MYAIFFSHRKQRSKLCEQLTYLFSHHAFSQRFFEFFINLLDRNDNDYYFNFMQCSNENFENLLTNTNSSNNSKNFYFLKKVSKNDDINDANAICIHQTDTRQRMQLDVTILSIKKLLIYKYKNDEQSISFCTAIQLLHDPCWKDEKGNFDLHRLCTVSNIFSGECTHPFDSNAISIMLNWDFMQQIDESIHYEMLYIISLLCFGHRLSDKEKAEQLQIWLMMNSTAEQLSLSRFMLKMPIIGMGLNIVNKLFNYNEKVRSLMRKHSLRLGALAYFPLKRVSLYLLCDYIQPDTLENEVPLIKILVKKKHKIISKNIALEPLVSLMEHEKIFCAH